MKVSLSYAKNNLPKLIKKVEAGEPVTICRRGVPLADLVPTKKVSGARPQFGTLREKFLFNDPNWWKPMTKSEAEDFFAGR